MWEFYSSLVLEKPSWRWSQEPGPQSPSKRSEAPRILIPEAGGRSCLGQIWPIGMIGVAFCFRTVLRTLCDCVSL
jgi:hypothetical protein